MEFPELVTWTRLRTTGQISGGALDNGNISNANRIKHPQKTSSKRQFFHDESDQTEQPIYVLNDNTDRSKRKRLSGTVECVASCHISRSRKRQKQLGETWTCAGEKEHGQPDDGIRRLMKRSVIHQSRQTAGHDMIVTSQESSM